MKLLELSFLFICLLPVSAEENLRLPDTRALALGGNGVTLSSFSNPALVQLSTDKVIHLEYFNRYALKELGSINGSFQYPNTYLSTGIHLASFGYERYRQNMGRIFLGKQLNTRWMMGVSFQYSWIQSELYEEIPARLSTDIGIVYIPFDKLLIGCVARDLPSVRISTKDLNLKELRTYAVQIGFNWEVLNNLLITTRWIRCRVRSLELLSVTCRSASRSFSAQFRSRFFPSSLAIRRSSVVASDIGCEFWCWFVLFLLIRYV